MDRSRDGADKYLVTVLWGLAAAVLLHDVYELLLNLSAPALGPQPSGKPRPR